MLLGMIIGIFSYHYHKEYTKAIVYTIFLMFVGALVGALVSMMLSSALYKSKVPLAKSRIDISAMSDGTSMYGHFFLGSGTIKDVQYYYYYELLDNGGFKQNKVTVSNTVIFESEDTTGYMVTFTYVLPDNHWAKGWIVDGCDCSSEKDTYEFHIPKGSVQREFKLDLE